MNYINNEEFYSLLKNYHEKKMNGNERIPERIRRNNY